MNFNKLRYVIVVAEERSITKAAKKLYISQPSLSQCIRSIEEDLGVDLFIRVKSSISHAGWRGVYRVGKSYARIGKAIAKQAGENKGRRNKTAGHRRLLAEKRSLAA